jgi:hypothetical protein
LSFIGVERLVLDDEFFRLRLLNWWEHFFRRRDDALCPGIK